MGLHEDLTMLIDILKKNLFPVRLIERVVNCYVTGTLSNHCSPGPLPTSPIFYFKLPYISHFSVVTQKKVRHLIKRYCNDFVSQSNECTLELSLVPKSRGPLLERLPLFLPNFVQNILYAMRFFW